jgi:hypothetical protein
MRTDRTKTRVAIALVFVGAGLPLIVQGLRAQTKPDVMALTPAEMKWGTQGG